MFNKTYLLRQPDVRHTHNTTINEHRAPTDESVKVLKEYHEKALQWASEAVFEKLEPISAEIAAFELQMVDNKIHICVNLNGRKVLMKMDQPYERFSMIKKLCETISHELVTQLFVKNPQLSRI